MWGETPAIGQRFILKDHLTEVVGVAEDGKYYEIMEPQQPVVFLPLFQTENGVAVFVVRTLRAQNETVTALERTLSAIEPNALITVQTWPDAMARSAIPSPCGERRTGCDGPAGCDAGGNRNLRHGRLQRKPPDEGAGHPRGPRRAHVHVMNAVLSRPIMLLGWDRYAGTSA